jgi:hypothetical protein
VLIAGAPPADATVVAGRADAPVRAATRFDKATYCGSRSLKSTSSGVAMKIDE